MGLTEIQWAARRREHYAGPDPHPEDEGDCIDVACSACWVKGYTFNPWEGCFRISEACRNCYAAARDVVWHHGEHWGRLAPRKWMSPSYWKQPARWNAKAAREGQRYGVFCASLADVFERHAAADVDATMSEYRAMLWRIVESTPWLDWMLLTKRPENMIDMTPPEWRERWPTNAWAMTTVEDQDAADKRLPELRKVPTLIRGLSMEPLLGRVSITQHLRCPICDGKRTVPWDPTRPLAIERRPCVCHPKWGTPALSFVILGGESGHGSRPFDLDAASDIMRQCDLAEVGVYVKQMGTVWSRSKLRRDHGGDPKHWPAEFQRRELPE